MLVSGVSASQSSTHNLPMILGVIIASAISGGLITTFGHFIPIILIAAMMLAVGSPFFSNFDVTSPISTWIGYQALTGSAEDMIWV